MSLFKLAIGKLAQMVVATGSRRTVDVSILLLEGLSTHMCTRCTVSARGVGIALVSERHLCECWVHAPSSSRSSLLQREGVRARA